MVRHPLVVVITLLIGFNSTLAQPASRLLPGTSAGRRVTAYITAFNSSDESALKKFFEEHLAKKALKDLPVEQRLPRARQLQNIAGTLNLHTVVRSNDSLVQVILQGSKAGWLDFTFEFEPDEPHGLLFIKVQQADNPDEPLLKPFSDEESFVSATAAYLNEAAKKEEFSGVVLVAKGDSIMFLQSYGNADRDKKIPNSVATRFNVGSIIKSFTRMAIYQLQDEGKLSLNDSIGKYLPDYPNSIAASKVTIRQLLEMESGIGDFFGDRFEVARKEEIRTLRDYLPLFADKPLEFEPGTGKRYSNGGYIVLGLIIEGATGMDYYSYVTQHIFKPAAMAGAGWFEKSNKNADIARGYIGKEHSSNYSTLPQRGSSAGGGYCGAGDLMRYIVAIRKGILRLPGSEGGLGIAGGAPGLNAALEWMPDRNYMVLVLSNFDPPAAETVARRIRRTLP